MKSARILPTMAVVIAGLLGTATEAEMIGSAFTYQAQLKETDKPVNDTVDLQFSLWDARTDGAQIGSTVTSNGVEVTNGLFMVQLDFGVAAFSGESRWLEVAVKGSAGSEFTTLSPRQPMTPNPYAIQTRGIFVDDAGNVGIGTTTPGEALEVAGTIRSSDGGFKFPDGTSQITAVQASGWAPNDGDVFYATGGVGIGTAGPLSQGDHSVTMSATLPGPRGSIWSAQAYDPTTRKIYVFGGVIGTSNYDQIIAYDPVTDTVSLKSAVLPTARRDVAAAYDPRTEKFYCFGGYDGSALSQIVAYDPLNDSLTVMSATLPTARGGTAAVFDPQTGRIYFFGGQDGGTYYADIVAYDAVSDTVMVMTAALPGARGLLAGAYDPQTGSIYCFGGYGGSQYDEIVAYDPVTDTVTPMAATLPTGRSGMSSAYVPGHGRIYCLGGWNSGGALAEILEYDPVGDTLGFMSATLPPDGNEGGSYDPRTGKIYGLGGHDGSSHVDSVYAYTPPGQTLLQIGDPGDGSGAIANTWSIFCSKEHKRDITPLATADYQEILGKLNDTDLFRYRYAHDTCRRVHLGVIAEYSPQEILASGGRAVSLADQSAFLMAALKAQQALIEEQRGRLNVVQAQLAETQSRLGRLEQRGTGRAQTGNGGAR